LLARGFSYLSMDRFYYLTEEVRAVKRMLTALLKTVRARQAKEGSAIHVRK
jgi:hypothetical protein